MLCICGTLLTHFGGVTPDLPVAQQNEQQRDQTRWPGGPSSSLLTTIANISVLIVAGSNWDFISPLRSSLLSQSPSLANTRWFEQLRFGFGELRLKRSRAQTENATVRIKVRILNTFQRQF